MVLEEEFQNDTLFIISEVKFATTQAIHFNLFTAHALTASKYILRYNNTTIRKNAHPNKSIILSHFQQISNWTQETSNQTLLPIPVINT